MRKYRVVTKEPDGLYAATYTAEYFDVDPAGALSLWDADDWTVGLFAPGVWQSLFPVKDEEEG